MRDLKKKKSCEPGFCHNIPLGEAAGRVIMRDLKKKKNCEPGFCTKTLLPATSEFYCERNKWGGFCE